ncbi:MAG: InlB B-repeat-containing protein, partial [Spirochaetales bacterium]|nr:InlB B-repeat-containing protein [Spirochaetales bacterium]
ALFGCPTEHSDSQNVQPSGDDGSKITSLQAVIDSDEVQNGTLKEIDLSKYANINDFDYNATINKSVTIKNGNDLKGATLNVVSDGVTLSGINQASVKTQSSLKISSSSLSSLSIAAVSSSGSLSSVEVNGRGDNDRTSTGLSARINPPTVETDKTTVANAVTVSIENAQITAEEFTASEINLAGMNTQLTIKDKISSISKIKTDKVCQVILEKGTGTNIPSSTDKIEVSASGELTQIDMTVQDGFTLIALTPMSSIKTLLRKGDSIDFSELVMLGTYKTTSRMKVFRANLTEDYTETFSKLEKNFTVTIDNKKAFENGKAVESFDWASLESCAAEIDIDCAKSPDYKVFKFNIAVIGSDNTEMPSFELTSITLNTDNVKKEYKVGDTLDLRGLVVWGTYKASDTLQYTGIVTDWTSSSANGTNLTEAEDKTITVTAKENTTLSDTFSISVKPVWTVTFVKDVSGDEQSSTIVQKVVQGKKADKPDNPVKIGYTFDGWYEKTGETFADTSYDFSTIVTKNLILYAVWNANQYTVTLWNDGDQSGDTIVDVTFDTIVPNITNLPSKIGYTFKGYFTENGGNGTQYIDDKGVGCKNWNIAENKTLYAYFLEKGKHSIEYRNTKGVTNIIPKEFKESESITLTSITADGWTFGGWSVVTDATADATIDHWNKGDLTSDVILWARWTANKYTVTLFNDGDQSGDISVDVTFDTIVPTITVPSKTGFTFGGYWTQADGQGTQYIDTG